MRCHRHTMRCHDDHMTCCILCAPKSARCVPDPFLLLGVGSGDETTCVVAHNVDSMFINCGVFSCERKKLQRRRGRERAHRAAETAAEKEERLRKRRKRDQERRAAETQEQRQTRLQRKRSRQSESFHQKLKNSEGSD